MTKYYILNLDPSAKYEWDRCALRDPITANRPDFSDLVAEAVGEQSGSYLVAVNIEVKVLEQAPIPETKQVPLNPTEVPARPPLPHLQELVA